MPIYTRSESIEILAQCAAIRDSLNELEDAAHNALMKHDLDDKLNKPYLKLVPNEETS